MSDRSFHPETVSWAGLLAQWVQFAQASLALPAEAHGSRWRESVAPIINLQAVTFALADLDRLAPADRPVALDKAQVLIDASSAQLADAWRGVQPPGAVEEIVHDAALALKAAALLSAARIQSAEDRE